MGMSSYVIDCEEKLFDIISEEIKTVDHLTEVMQTAVKHK